MPDSDRTPRVTPGSERRVLVPTHRASHAWKYIGWFGLVLAAAGLTDLALVVYPPRFGTPDWEFGTVAALVAGLPLATIGLAGLVGAGAALGKRWLLGSVGVVLLLGAVVVAALVLLFLTNVPLALRSVEGPVLLGVKKAIVKTVALGVYFGVAYGVAAFWALRRSLGRALEES